MIGLRTPTEDDGHLTSTHVNFKVLAGQQK